MSESKMDRREFVRSSAIAAAAGAAAGACARVKTGVRPSSVLNYNENMEYRRLGKTGLMASTVCLGGHWKELDRVVPGLFKGDGWLNAHLSDPAFVKNRDEVVSRCMEVGINYIDACTGQEAQAYARTLKGRRDKMYLGYSFYQREMRFDPWRNSVAKMMEGFDQGLKECALDYVDLWRITMEEQTGKGNTEKHVEVTMECLALAKKQGKARFTGLSSHDRDWLKGAIEKYPNQLDVIVTPYTAGSKVLPTHSLFEAIQKCDVGCFGIKPFGGLSLFTPNREPGGSDAEENNRRARLAIRYILCNPAVTAPIPGLISIHQVDNVAKAVTERRELDATEKAELEKATQQMWACLPHEYRWLRDWEYV